MEVVCVSLPGYIVARQGMFDADKQKFVANLNVALFTPCLSMCDRIYGNKDTMLTEFSFHKIGEAIDCGEVGGTGCHSSHLRYSDTGLVLGLDRCFKGIWIQEATCELCDCYGCKSIYLGVYAFD